MACELSSPVALLLLVLLAVVMEAGRCNDARVGIAVDAEAARVVLRCSAVGYVCYELLGGIGRSQLLGG